MDTILTRRLSLFLHCDTGMPQIMPVNVISVAAALYVPVIRQHGKSHTQLYLLGILRHHAGSLTAVRDIFDTHGVPAGIQSRIQPPTLPADFAQVLDRTHVNVPDIALTSSENYTVEFNEYFILITVVTFRHTCGTHARTHALTHARTHTHTLYRIEQKL